MEDLILHPTRRPGVLPGTWGSSKPVGIFHWSTCSLSALTSSMSPGTLHGEEMWVPKQEMGTHLPNTPLGFGGSPRVRVGLKESQEGTSTGAWSHLGTWLLPHRDMAWSCVQTPT